MITERYKLPAAGELLLLVMFLAGSFKKAVRSVNRQTHEIVVR